MEKSEKVNGFFPQRQTISLSELKWHYVTGWTAAAVATSDNCGEAVNSKTKSRWVIKTAKSGIWNDQVSQSTQERLPPAAVVVNWAALGLSSSVGPLFVGGKRCCFFFNKQQKRIYSSLLGIEGTWFQLCRNKTNRWFWVLTSTKVILSAWCLSAGYL